MKNYIVSSSDKPAGGTILMEWIVPITLDQADRWIAEERRQNGAIVEHDVSWLDG